METYTVETQHGKIVLKIEASIDPALERLGLSSEKIEQTAMAILHEKFQAIGGQQTRPVKWDN